MNYKLKLYIENNLINNEKELSLKKLNFFSCDSIITEHDENFDQSYYSVKSKKSISTFIDTNKDEYVFQRLLFNHIDKKGLKDSDVYNKVNMDRRLFSKIRSDANYHPSKDTIILLGLSLELSEEEIVELLESSSYSLPKNNHYDLIIRFCFVEGIYNVMKVNELLQLYNCKLLILKTE